MDVLLIGGTGNISAYVTRRLLARGDRVWLFHRSPHPELEALGATTIRGDFNDVEGMKAALAGRTFDAAADFVCFTPEHALRDWSILRGRVGQHLFISSATVYQKPLKTFPVREDTPLRNPFSAYARSKIACELALLEKYREDDFPVTIVRPSHTYGETRLVGAVLSWQDAPWTLIDRARRGKPTLVHGDGRSLWTLTHSDDFAAAFVGLVGNPASIGHAFHITSDEVLTWDEIATIFARACGAEPVLAHVPSEFIETHWPKFAGSLLGDKAESLVFDNAKIKRFVPGFQCRIPFHEGIRRSIAYYEAHPELQIVDEAYNRGVDDLIAKHRAL